MTPPWLPNDARGSKMTTTQSSKMTPTCPTGLPNAPTTGAPKWPPRPERTADKLHLASPSHALFVMCPGYSKEPRNRKKRVDPGGEGKGSAPGERK